MIWALLVGAPFNEKAITEAQHHSDVCLARLPKGETNPLSKIAFL
jgi:hypothetical protein